MRKHFFNYMLKTRSKNDCKIMMTRSPKCHPELAGEGIEHDWAGVKSHYRRARLSEKKGSDNFRNLVTESLESVGFNQRASFSGCAREHMLAYNILGCWEGLPNEIKGEEPLPETSAQLLDTGHGRQPKEEIPSWGW